MNVELENANTATALDLREVSVSGDNAHELWSKILAAYRSENYDGALFKILQKIHLIYLDEGGALLQNTGKNLNQHEKKMVTSRVLQIMQCIETPLPVTRVRFLSDPVGQTLLQRRPKVLASEVFLEHSESQLLPSEITSVSALAMNIKEAELLGLVQGQGLKRAVVSYCFVSFGHGDVKEFASHMRYDTINQMLLDVSEIDRLWEKDKEVRGLVNLVMTELTGLFLLPFDNGTEDEDVSQQKWEPVGENIINFPTCARSVLPLTSASSPFSALLNDMD